MKFAIFPGTFNPIHIGHLMIAEAASAQFQLDLVHFVLSPKPPHKTGSTDLLAIEQRVELIERSIANNLAFFLDQREIRTDRPTSYTIDTVREIKQERGLSDKLGLILGLDSFLSLGGWKHAEDLGGECYFLVASRPGWDQAEIEETLSEFHQELEWQLIDNPPLAISATQIRTRKRQGKPYRYLLSEETFALYHKMP